MKRTDNEEEEEAGKKKCHYDDYVRLNRVLVNDCMRLLSVLSVSV